MKRRSFRPGGWREITSIAYPLILSNGAFTIMQFCDRVFLSRYSGISIQAALPAGILSFTFVCLFQALAGYAGTFVAQYHGAGDKRGCVKATVQGIWLAIFSWPVILALIPLGWWLMKISGHNPEVMKEERIYFSILMLGAVSVSLSSAISGYFIGRSRMFLNTVANISGCVINVVLDYAMIFGKWGFPEMGIKGAAIATVISGFWAPILQMTVFFCEREVSHGGWRKTFRIEPKLMWRMIRFGLPSGGHLLVDVSAFTVFVMMTGRLDEVSLAASNTGFAINNLAFMPLIGISTAASVLVGQYQGRRESDYANRAAWSAIKLGWCYMAIAALSFILFPSAYLNLFRSSKANYTMDELLAIGRPMMTMMAAWGMFDAVSIIFSGALKGAGDTRFVMLYMLIFGWCIWLPVEMIALTHGGSILSAWLILTIYILILALGFLWRWQSGKWRTIKLIEHEAPTMMSQREDPVLF